MHQPRSRRLEFSTACCIATLSSGGHDASRSSAASGCQRTTYGGPGSSDLTTLSLRVGRLLPALLLRLRLSGVTGHSYQVARTGWRPDAERSLDELAFVREREVHTQMRLVVHKRRALSPDPGEVVEVPTASVLDRGSVARVALGRSASMRRRNSASACAFVSPARSPARRLAPSFRLTSASLERHWPYHDSRPAAAPRGATGIDRPRASRDRPGRRRTGASRRSERHGRARRRGPAATLSDPDRGSHRLGRGARARGARRDGWSGRDPPGSHGAHGCTSACGT